MRQRHSGTPLTAAERQRRRRAKIAADPRLQREHKAKECARWHQRVQSGKVHLIAELTSREQRHQRRRWRQQWNDRMNKKSLTTTTTPSTPVHDHSASVSRQRSSGRKQVRRDRSRAHRRIKLLEAKLAKSVAANNMMRKRLSRERQRKFSSQSTCTSSSAYVDSQNTPRKAARRIMASPRKNARALIYHCSLLSDLRSRLKRMRRTDRRVAVSVFCAAKLLRKHRLMSAVQRDLGLRLRNRQSDNKSKQTRLSRFAAAHSKRNLLQAFFEHCN